MSSIVKSNSNGSYLEPFISDFDKWTIGYDSLFDKMFRSSNSLSNYPPINIISLEDNKTLVEVALAGFKKDELKVYTQDGKLFVEGNKSLSEDQKEIKYQHRGLAKRSFVQSILMSDDQVVDSVEFEDGLLTINISRVVPDHQKRKDYL